MTTPPIFLVSLSPPRGIQLLRLGEGPKAKNVLDTSDFDFEVPIAVVAVGSRCCSMAMVMMSF